MDGFWFKGDSITTALAWDRNNSIYCPGASGSREVGSSGNNASAGAGGAVAIWY
jgi:hypothetical protein